MPNAPIIPGKHQSLFAYKTFAYTTVLLAYASYLWFFDFLTFPLKEDEIHFWHTVLHFSESVLPSLEKLSDYGDLNTPLPFIIYGTIEYLTDHGLIIGRYINYLLSLSMVIIIVRLLPGKAALMLIFPLVFNPYLILTSNFLYTDIIAISAIFSGIIAYIYRRYWLSMGLFILAISSRQYMLAFPMGIILFEVSREFYQLYMKQQAVSLKLIISQLLSNKIIIPMLLAGASLLFWVWLFGDYGPASAIAGQNISTQGSASLHPKNALYFLSACGLYFVLPEFILRGQNWPGYLWLQAHQVFAIVLAASLLILFIAYPPIQNEGTLLIARMGLFDYALRLLDSPDILRVSIFYCLALLTVLRLSKLDLASMLIIANTILMIKAHVAWEKYSLPLVIILFLLTALSSNSHTPKTHLRPFTAGRINF